MLKRINGIYKQHGCRFYRDGLTFNQQSANAYLYAKYYQDVPAECNFKDVLVGSMLQNFGKMLDKNATPVFSSYLLSVYGVSPSVYRPISMLDLARNYLFTTSEQYNRFVTHGIKSRLLILSDSEIVYFKENAHSRTAEEIAMIEVMCGNKRDIVLSEKDWEFLESSLTEN